MSTNAKRATRTVLLHRRVIVANALIFQAEREVRLPIEPFVGLRLYNTEWRPPGCDENEDRIKEIAYDLKTGRVLCYLPTDDYRAESSGSDEWTEEDVRQRYRDWTLERVTPRKPPRGTE